MIINPNVNPEEEMMELTRIARVWESLKEREEAVGQLVITLTTLQNALRQYRLDGLVEGFDNIEKYLKPRNVAYVEMQNLINFMSQWEQAYFNVLSAQHGEEKVQQKLAQAMKGPENE